MSLVAALILIQAFLDSGASAQSSDPSALPRLAFSDLQYIGGFRLPAETANGDSFSAGGRALAFSPAGNSLFVGSRAGRVAEVSIPSPVNTSNVTAMPFATFLQPFADPTEGRVWEVSSDGAGIDGIMIYGNRLYGTASIYYDANNVQRVSHYSHSLQLNESSFQGWSQVWETAKTGFVSGFMARVPAEWQARLGGPAVTGQCCIPIVTRTSWGPAAFSFNPASIGEATVAASPLLYYTGEHQTLGPWDGSSPTYGATISMGGLAIIAGTRTALYFGRNGIGPNCYGNGTGDQSLHGTVGPDGALWCYDPTSGGKGSHAYPYRYQIWAYDLNDFAAVKSGTKQPWEIVPYGVWPFELPTPEPSVWLGGVGYDPERQIIYISQLGADKDGYSYRAVIHALHVNVPGYTVVPADPPPPASGVTLATDLQPPQKPGTTIRVTASPVGGTAPHQYKWWTYDGLTWTAAGDWTASSQLEWTPATSNASFRIGVWVRSKGNSTEVAETSTSMPFAIEGGGATSGPVKSVTLTPNRTAPQPPGTAIGWAAAASGGTAPLQYKWWVYDGVSWAAIGDWSTSSVFAWTPTTANAAYRVGVWVKSSVNLNDAMEASTSEPFAIGPTAASGSPVASVTLGTDKIQPQSLGATITWTAVPAAGSGPFLYKWWTFDGSTWTPAGTWTSSNTFAWTPSLPNANYRVGVWVKRASNPADEQEASASLPFLITGLSPNPPGPVTSVAIAADRQAPLPAGSAITWTATPVSGIAPLQYKWWIFNGDTWTVVGDWTTSNVFSWKPLTQNPSYRIGVWVRSAGKTTDEAEASTSQPFAITP